MPTRIRSNGMSIALLVNQAVSTTTIATLHPTANSTNPGHHRVEMMAFEESL